MGVHPPVALPSSKVAHRLVVPEPPIMLPSALPPTYCRLVQLALGHLAAKLPNVPASHGALAGAEAWLWMWTTTRCGFRLLGCASADDAPNATAATITTTSNLRMFVLLELAGNLILMRWHVRAGPRARAESAEKRMAKAAGQSATTSNLDHFP